MDNNWIITPALGDSHTHKINQRLILSQDEEDKDYHIVMVDKSVICDKIAIRFKVNSFWGFLKENTDIKMLVYFISFIFLDKIKWHTQYIKMNKYFKKANKYGEFFFFLQLLNLC